MARRQACHTANAFDALFVTAVNLVMTQAAVLRVDYAFSLSLTLAFSLLSPHAATKRR